ncbi:MAG: molybdenum cofactor synthesis domain-containing protein [Roseobacter sp.]
MVDWSGGNDRGVRPVQDAIWACLARGGRAEEPVYLRNRHVAEDWIAETIAAEQRAGRCVLAGFDFSFGYPAGFGKALTGQDDPLAVWSWFEDRVEDAPKHNNRFDLAGQINLDLGAGRGPFWANGLKRDVKGLPRTMATYQNPFPKWRAVEHRATGAFTCWQMAGAGAVGSQVFMGLPVLARLRRRFDAAAWPFEPLDKAVALVEIWPSLTVTAAPEGWIKDAWQVSEVARSLSALDAETLAMMLAVDAPEEGWILGVGHEAALQEASQVPPRLNNNCFALPPGVNWTPVSEALALLQARLTPVTLRQRTPLASAIGRFAASDVIALRSNPPLPNTAVDGYGFEGSAEAGVHQLPLAEGRAAAGDTPTDLPKGHAIRVLTGAALPGGVDTVVLQEDVVVKDGAIHFRGPLKKGANARQAGEDVAKGDVILRQGARIGAAEAALLAATGVSAVQTYAPLRVAVLSTGDEVQEAGSEAAAHQIYDANRPMLLKMIKDFGHLPVDLGRVPDDPVALADRLTRGAQEADVILTSGGASAGDEDHVSALLRQTGAMELWRVAVKPGRPLALGLWQGVPVFGLPGNPVAAMVCTLIFAYPALAQLAGGLWPVPQGFDMPAAFSKRKKDGRSEYLRARIREGRVETFASEGSGRISGLVWAEGLVALDHGAQQIEPGDLVRYIPFTSFGLTP